MLLANKISSIVNASKEQLSQSNEVIKHLCTDSRSVFSAKGTLFIALKSGRNDGHKYIKTVYERGIRNFLVTDTSSLNGFEDANIWQVDNTLLALQTIAQHARNQVNLPIIGITGSNGKTIVKEWLYHGLRNTYNICRSPKSYNSQIGVPLSVWQLKKEHELGVFEAGISQPNEMDALASIIQPTIGVFTHIGDAHQENFSDKSQKIKEKLKLFKTANSVIYPKDETDLDQIIQTTYPEKQLLSWSLKDKNAWLYCCVTKTESAKTIIEITLNNRTNQLVIPFVNKASVYNALTSIAVWCYLKLDWQTIQSKLNSLPKLGMRLEMLNGVNNSTIINDAYSLDIDSLRIALDFQNSHHTNERKWVVLSDFPYQLTPSDFELVANLLQSAAVDQLFVVGNSFAHNKSLFESFNLKNLESTQQLAQHLKQNPPSHTSVLVKGARIFKFEELIQVLEPFKHQTRLEINLSAIQHNLSVYKEILAPNTKVMAMVKAFSYGSGSHEIAQWLQANQVDYLAVAFTNEAIALREHGIQLPIMTMNAEPDSFQQMIDHSVEPEIFNINILEQFIEALNQQGVQEAYPIHIKLETGMNRLGFTSNELDKLIQLISSKPLLKVVSIFSHLSSSDMAEEDDYSKQQLEIFKQNATYLENGLGYSTIKHIANSAGIARFPEAHFDMVRLGIGLYGYSSEPSVQQKLEVVAQLKTTITHIKEVPANSSVGYSRAYKTDQPKRIATLPIGYADGLRRGLNTVNAYASVNNNKAFYVGNICMDMCMIDVSDIPCEIGDDVIIFGENPNLSQISTWYRTIPYEVATAISQRVKRLYIKN